MNRTIDRRFEVKSINDAGEFTAYGSVFGNVDHDRDIVMPGAFSKSLEAHKENGTKPAMLWQHKHDEPIGVYSLVEEDEKGLYTEGQLLLDDPTAKRAHVHMKAKSVSGMSIGFRVAHDGYEYSEEKEAFLLKEIDLHEISVVTFPANDQARIETVKNFIFDGEVPPPSIVERSLRDAFGFDRQQAKAFLAEGYKGISTRDAEDDVLEYVSLMKAFSTHI